VPQMGTAYDREKQFKKDVEVIPERLASVEENVASVEAATTNLENDTTNYKNQVQMPYTEIESYNFGNAAVTGGSTGPAGSTRIFNRPIGKDGWLRKINMFVNAVGTVKVKFFTKNNDDTFNLEREVSLTTAIGLNTYVSDTDFNGFYVKRNWYLGYYSADVAVYCPSTGNKWNYWTKSGTDATGENIVINLPPTTQKFDYALNIDIDVMTIKHSNKHIIRSEKFGSVLQSDIVTTSGWTKGTNGIQSPTTGGWDSYFYYDIYSTLDKSKIATRIQVKDVTSVFALIRKYTTNGTVAEVNCVNKTLKFYASWSGGTTAPSVKASVTIPFDFVVDREYIVELEKDASNNIFTLTDTVTRQSVTLKYDNASVTTTADYVGKQWGAPGVMFLSGSIFVKSFELVSLVPKSVKNVIIGDSITEGYLFDKIVTPDNRWAAKVRDKLNGSCVISGRGSGDSADLLLRWDSDVANFNPSFVTVFIGTNDTTYDTWKANIDTIIANILAIGAEPILCAMKTSTIKTTANTYLRSLPYTVVGFDYALSTEIMLDSYHPNIAGHQAMFEQYLIDAPQVFY